MKTLVENPKTICKKMLLKENPKALQYLHHAHGFNFEKPFFLGSIPGRFTYKMISDMIAAYIGPEYIAALLMKPDNSRSYNNRLHHITMNGYKFTFPERSKTRPWEYGIDDFFGVGDFEEQRKHHTERVYIIAQKPEYLVTPKNDIPIESDTRYRIDTRSWRGGITKTTDGRGNTWISEIVLKSTDGKRKNVTFKPWNSFNPAERRSDDINDYIDKSGYILRFRHLELHAAAVDRKRQHNAERLEKTDFSEREKKAAADIAAVKRYLIGLIENAETYDAAAAIDRAAGNFRYLMMDFDRMESAKFASVESKNRYFDSMAERAEKILNGGNN